MVATATNIIIMLASLSAVRDEFYDCQLRKIALDYTAEVVVGPVHGWSAARAANAVALVSKGLNVKECNMTAASQATNEEHSSAPAPVVPPPSAPVPSITLYVATTGSDDSAGTETDPLATVAGAQALIRKQHPAVTDRPAITVRIQPGEYLFGEDDAATHLVRATRYSNLAMATFTEKDSGASPMQPITYTAAEGAGTVQFVGYDAMDSATNPRLFRMAPTTNPDHVHGARVGLGRGLHTRVLLGSTILLGLTPDHAYYRLSYLSGVHFLTNVTTNDATTLQGNCRQRPYMESCCH
jgi:hypothetical protein